MNYKNFENDNFRQDLKKDILQMLHYQNLIRVLSVLHKHAPNKMKYIRPNNCLSIHRLYNKKARQESDMPMKIITDTIDIFF